MKYLVQTILAIGLTAGLLASSAGSALAQEAEVVADGLNGPQGVLVHDDGSIWVIDTGLGGDETIEVLDTETGEIVDASIGQTGQVVRIDSATRERAVVTTVASVASSESGYGGARLAAHGGGVYATVGEWAMPDVEKPVGMASVLAIGGDGSTTEVADTWAHELAENPYVGGTSHSHPYGMATGPDGRLLYADAGANALMAVDVATGEIETVVAFEPLPGVFPRPDYGGEMLTDPVPTAVVVQDGRIFVSLLSGAPFVPGSAKVVEVLPDGSVSDHAVGLTMLTDLTEGPDGNLYATTFAEFGEQGPAPASGSVTRILPDGSTELAVPGLNFATAIDFDADGNAYVAINGVGAPGSGQVLRISDVAVQPQLPLTGGELPVVLALMAVAITGAGALLIRFELAIAAHH